MPPNTFRLLRSGALPGAANMALDEALSGDGTAPPAPSVRLYRWRPFALSLGYFQRAREEDLAPFREAGHGVTRRATGGGAIFHADEVTYSVVLPAGDPRLPRDAAASYAFVHRAVLEALRSVGVEASIRGADPPPGPDPFFCFRRTTGLDLVARGRKVVGSAQRRTRASFLQHGSIPLSPNATAPDATSLAEERGGAPVDADALETALGLAFARLLGAEAVPSEPTTKERARALALEAAKYGNPAWVLRPWKGRGRPSAASASLPPVPRADAPPPPLRVLAASVLPDALRVDAAAGGTRPLLPHARLAAVEAGRVRRSEERAVPGARDPWDSTFRRSHFGQAGPRAEPPSHEKVMVEEVETIVFLVYRAPGEVLRLDAARFNYRSLGPGRTGRPAEDLARLLGALLERAPTAVPGPGAGAAREGREPPLYPDERSLEAAARLLSP